MGYLVGAIFCMLGLAMLSTLLAAIELWVRRDASVMGLNGGSRSRVLKRADFSFGRSEPPAPPGGAPSLLEAARR